MCRGVSAIVIHTARIKASGTSSWNRSLCESNEDPAGLFPRDWQSESFGEHVDTASPVERAVRETPGDTGVFGSLKRVLLAVGRADGIAVLAASRYFHAAERRRPGRVGPFNRASIRHQNATTSLSLVAAARRSRSSGIGLWTSHLGPPNICAMQTLQSQTLVSLFTPTPFPVAAQRPDG